MSVDAGPWRRLDAVDESLGLPIRAQLADEPILIFATAAGLRGVQSRCPHADYSLAHSEVIADGERLRCNFHNFIFHLSDGRGANCPNYRLGVFDIKEEAGTLFARPAAE
jgi:nitrite reductase/ring-hydroxylating ferredoxin subunit